MNRQEIRVVTYNLLSEKFFSKKHYPSISDQSSFEWYRRWKIIKNKIIKQMNNKAQSNDFPPQNRLQPIFCLQEVTLSFNDELALLFHQNKYFYHFVSYGSSCSGYMGIAIAFPSLEYKLDNLEIFNLAHTKQWPRHTPPASASSLTADLNFEANNDEDDDDEDSEKAECEVENERRRQYWKNAKNKQNKLLFVRLSTKTSKTFCIATYHIPSSKVDNEVVMLIHSKLLKDKVVSLAQNDAYIIAGDFNFEPSSASYSFITTSSLSPQHREYIPLPVDDINDEFMRFEDRGVELKSAYSVVTGNEPLYTSYAHPNNLNEDEYRGTLDYLFYDATRCTVLSVLQIPDLHHPIPSADEPSDHLMIGASFALH